MNDTIITPEAEQALEQISNVVKTIIVKANSVKVTNDEEFSFSTSFRGDLKNEIKKIEKMRKDLVDPLNQTVKKINNAFKLRSEPLEKSDEILENKMKIYYIEKERKLQAENDRLNAIREAEAQKLRDAQLEAIKKADRARSEGKQAEATALAESFKLQAEEAETPIVFEAVETQARTENALSSIRKVWKFEVENILAVPSDYLMINDKEVNQAIRNGVREINGLRIFQDVQVSIRS